MNKNIIFLCLLFVFSCCNDDDNEPLPDCLVPIVDVILEQNVQNPKANIELYMYNGEEVYLINAQNFPDGQSYVISKDCEDICVLGGFDGTDNDCPNWYDNDEVYRIEIIWTDPR